MVSFKLGARQNLESAHMLIGLETCNLCNLKKCERKEVGKPGGNIEVEIICLEIHLELLVLLKPGMP